MDASGIVSLVPFLLIFLIMYVLIIRPQQKKVKEHQNMIANIRRGDVVITQGGIIGKVAKLKDDEEIELEVAEGVRLRIVKGTLAAVKSKTEPVE